MFWSIIPRKTNSTDRQFSAAVIEGRNQLEALRAYIESRSTEPDEYRLSHWPNDREGVPKFPTRYQGAIWAHFGYNHFYWDITPAAV